MSQLPPSCIDQPSAEPYASPDALDWLTLTLFPGIGPSFVQRLVQHFSTPKRVFSSTSDTLCQVEGIGGRLAAKIADPVHIKAARKEAMQILERARNLGCSVLSPDDSLYPQLLRTITDPPVVLFCRGRLDSLARPSVAIVGSRAATSYGKRVSFELARELARNGFCVVSGMAMGIDGEAHRGALAGGGETLGVLGCGIDVIYPHQHEGLFREVAQRGLLISEYPPATPPDGFRFPERNRIISGIATGIIVVEASLKSGSLITASLALDQGREVFAVPGRIDSPKSQGTHRLLQQGAKLVNSVDDILEELETGSFYGRREIHPHKGARKIELPEDEEKLLACLDVYPVTIDELVRESGYDTPVVFQMLLRLELQGLVRQMPGQQYELIQQKFD